MFQALRDYHPTERVCAIHAQLWICVLKADPFWIEARTNSLILMYSIDIFGPFDTNSYEKSCVSD